MANAESGSYDITVLNDKDLNTIVYEMRQAILRINYNNHTEDDMQYFRPDESHQQTIRRLTLSVDELWQEQKKREAAQQLLEENTESNDESKRN